MKSNKIFLLIAVAALLLIGLARSGDEGSGDGSPGSEATTTESTAVAGAETGPRYSDLEPIAIGDLPIEAIETLVLIEDGGPFPFERDDLIFENREGILPAKPVGHYREYTVVTPGEDDRGARRVVAGDDGELYYTDDHYGSFREIVAR